MEEQEEEEEEEEEEEVSSRFGLFSLSLRPGVLIAEIKDIRS